MTSKYNIKNYLKEMLINSQNKQIKSNNLFKYIL